MNSLRVAPILVALMVATNAFAASGDEIRSANAVGPANAPVTIEFFSDLQCPQCARYEPMVKSVRGEFNDKVRMVIRHFPINTHEHAELAACAAEAAANQKKFWEMAEALYKTQWMWAKAPAPRTIIMDQAKQLGLDTDRFVKDMDGSEVRERIGMDMQRAKSLGVKLAPSVVINGYNVPNSQFSEDGFRNAIKAALAKAGQ
ncbi:MAG TPA: thioredoxin domain-containing protein [Chthoniobacterales bacterium]